MIAPRHPCNAFCFQECCLHPRSRHGTREVRRWTPFGSLSRSKNCNRRSSSTQWVLRHAKRSQQLFHCDAFVRTPVQQECLHLTFWPQRRSASHMRRLMNCLPCARCWSGIGPVTIHSRRSGSSSLPGCWLTQNAPVERSCGSYNACFLIAISSRIYARYNEGCAKSERDCEPAWSCSGKKT